MLIASTSLFMLFLLPVVSVALMSVVWGWLFPKIDIPVTTQIM
jgi:hypothetical protein